jgi:hemerythrin-like domain-containing protein
MISHEAAMAKAGEPNLHPAGEAIPLSLADAPLDYIFADHFRQRGACAALTSAAAIGRIPQAEAESLAAFLEHDVTLHHDDEDHDLFPAVRRRALAEDGLDAVLMRLADDHRRARSMIRVIVDALTPTPRRDPVELAPESRDVMKAYAESERRHIAMENGILMAIARIRLKPADLAAIGQAMKRRRGAQA